MNQIKLKHLPRKTAADRVLRDTTFNIAKNPNYDGSRSRFNKWFTKFLIKKTSNTNKGIGIDPENKELVEDEKTNHQKT